MLSILLDGCGCWDGGGGHGRCGGGGGGGRLVGGGGGFRELAGAVCIVIIYLSRIVEK